jgi:hypothetical protein
VYYKVVSWLFSVAFFLVEMERYVLRVLLSFMSQLPLKILGFAQKLFFLADLCRREQ